MAYPETDTSLATRYQLRLKGPANELLNQMCEQLHATPRDVILDALAVFYFAIQETSKGLEVGSYDAGEKRFTAVVTPSLQNLKSTKRVEAGAVMRAG